MEISLLRITSLYLWIYFNIYITVKSTAILQGSREYCNWESVNATCGDHEVLVVESARYGRMATGRCVSKEYGYVGCLSDVLNILDSRCSGRRQCSFPVNQFITLNVRPCPKDVTSYLEVSHRCLPVSQGTVSSCVNDRKLVVDSSSGYLSSSMTADHGFGTNACPWVIKAKEGQKINITLIDFGIYARQHGDGAGGGDRHSLYCHKYAEISEGSAGRGGAGQGTPICAGGDRQRNVYISKGSTVTVKMSRTDKNQPHFILRYETFGCPNPKPQRGTTFRMVGTTAKVTCESTGESWTLTCRGSEWFGKAANCTPAPEEKKWTSLFGSEWSSSGGILIVIALGVGLGIVIGVCLLAVSLVILKRRGWKFGCGKNREHIDLSPSMVSKQTPIYEYNPSAHKYSSGYGSEALLGDNIPIDPRYNVAAGHYGDMNTGSWVTSSAGVHGYNRSLNSQSSLGHIYESPDFLSAVGGASRDAC